MDVIAVADTKKSCSHRVLRSALTHLLSNTTNAEAILELTVEWPPKDPMKWDKTRNHPWPTRQSINEQATQLVKPNGIRSITSLTYFAPQHLLSTSIHEYWTSCRLCSTCFCRWGLRHYLSELCRTKGDGMPETEEIQQILRPQTTSIEKLSINYFYNSDNINAIKPHP